MLSLMSSVVDGGHRAIKYTRIDGVKPDIYNEGTHFAVCSLIILPSADLMIHHIMHSSLSSRSPGWRHPLYSTFVQSRVILPASLALKVQHLSTRTFNLNKHGGVAIDSL
jgi:hypothetical protein